MNRVERMNRGMNENFKPLATRALIARTKIATPITARR